jgi:hypothetical protein
LLDDFRDGIVGYDDLKIPKFLGCDLRKRSPQVIGPLKCGDQYGNKIFQGLVTELLKYAGALGPYFVELSFYLTARVPVMNPKMEFFVIVA